MKYKKQVSLLAIVFVVITVFYFYSVDSDPNNTTNVKESTKNEINRDSRQLFPEIQSNLLEKNAEQLDEVSDFEKTQLNKKILSHALK